MTSTPATDAPKAKVGKPGPSQWKKMRGGGNAKKDSNRDEGNGAQASKGAKHPANGTSVSNWSTTVISTLTVDTAPSIMVTFDNARYLFGAPENTCRMMGHSSQTLKKIRGLFVTGVGVERMGGISGLLMTIADSQTSSSLHIAGPEGTLHALASARGYVYREGLAVHPIEVAGPSLHSSTPLQEEPIFKDENIELYAAPLTPENAFGVDVGTMDVDEGSLKRKRSVSPTDEELQQPRKRASMSAPSATTTTSLPTDLQSSHSLEELMSSPTFKPSDLAGSTHEAKARASEWRKLCLGVMFPASPSPACSSTKDSSSTSAVPADVDNRDEYRRSRRRVPRGFWDALPDAGLAAKGTTANTPSTTFANNPTTLLYTVVGPRMRGKFDADKASALGVHGALRGRLTRGLEVEVATVVTNPDGTSQTVKTIVRPEDVVGPSEAPSVVVIVDVPSPLYIPSLLSQVSQSEVLGKLWKQKTQGDDYNLKAVYHQLGPGVLEDPRYVEWMRGFGDNVDHLIASPHYTPNAISFTSAAANMAKLALLDSEMFAVGAWSGKAEKELKDIPSLPSRTHLTRPNLRTGIRPYAAPVLDMGTGSISTNPTPAANAPTPSFGARDLFTPLLRTKKSRDGAIQLVPVVDLPKDTHAKFKQAIKQVVAAHTARSDSPTGSSAAKPGDDVRVVPLGTGSAIPGKYRTVSSTLIMIPGWGNVLLDAGEGTYGQLARKFGPGADGVDKVLRDLKLLFVSHIHGDHHMGVGTILRKRLELQSTLTDPLFLMTLRSVHMYLQEAQEVQDLGIRPDIVDIKDATGRDVIPIMSEALHWRNPGVYPTSGYWQVFGNESWIDPTRTLNLSHSVLATLGLERLSAVDMRHGTRCYGLVMKHNDGWSIAFSGDTVPTDSLVYAAPYGCTLLIHEATMSDDQAELANAKKHSTFGGAIGIGKKMGAKNILLTHFSARHPKIPMSALEMTEPSSPSSPSSAPRRAPAEIALAFDQATLRIGDMWKMKYYLPALEANWKDMDEVEGDAGEEDEGRLRAE